MTMRKHNKPATGPVVTRGHVSVARDGRIRFADADLVELGIDARVAVFTDADALSIGIEAAFGRDGYRLQRGVTGGGSLLGAAMLKSLFVDPLRCAGTYPAVVSDKRLVFTLPESARLAPDERPGPMTFERLTALVSRIEYRDWRFRIGKLGDGHFLQVEFVEPEDGVQRGAKWYISNHATPGEALQKALQAVLSAEEHEAREKFRYAGKALFHPHHSIASLVEIADRLEVRL